MFDSEQKWTLGFVALWCFIALINIAWIGTLIWAIVYVVTHLGEWIG